MYEFHIALSPGSSPGKLFNAGAQLRGAVRLATANSNAAMQAGHHAAAAAIIGMHVPEGARRTALVDAKVVDEAGAPTMEACEDLVDWAAGRAFEVHAASASALAELEELFGEEDRMDRMFGEEEESEDENN